jgi:putative oxidoreductase
MGKPMNELTRTKVVVAWICRVVAATILLQTLFFKFTAAPESVYIFTKIGIEPWGRIGSGVAELIAAILLFVPGLTWLGAALALGIMGGAIVSHLTVLGIEVQGDHGLLFGLAVAVVVCSAALLFVYRRSIPVVGNLLLK